MEFELAIANTQLQMEAMAARLAACVPCTQTEQCRIHPSVALLSRREVTVRGVR